MSYENKVPLYERKISKLRQSCDTFCVHNLQETTFVCAIDNFLCNSAIYNLYALLQFLTFVCPIAIH